MHIFIISIIAFLQDVWLSSIKIRYLKKDFEDALAKLKKLNGLKENDDLVKLTLDVLKTPRCGEKYSSTFPSTRHLVKKNGHYNLTIHVEKPSHLISEKIQKSIIEGSIKSWNEHIPIVFQWVTNDADIDIVFIDDLNLNTTQNTVPIMSKLHQRGNNTVVYISNAVTSSESLLNRTVYHMIGHVLGISHDVLSPLFYTTTTTTHSAFMATAGGYQTTISSILSHMHDGKTYIFKKNIFWKLSKAYQIDNINYPQRINVKAWNGVPDDIDEGFVYGKNWNTYFFKGSSYYRYNSNLDRVDDGYPFPISMGWKDVPDNIDAAFTDPSLKTFFFKGDLVYLFDNAKDRVADGYPKKIDEEFPGIPNNIDTVFRYYFDAEVYFFKDFYFWKWDYKNNRAIGPHAINLGWKNLCWKNQKP